MATNESSPVPLPGATYRFVVKSAEEAVRMIHDKLGAEARVISVKQVGARGLASLIRAPQLEVIAEVTSVLAPTPATASPPRVPGGEESTKLDIDSSPAFPVPTFTEPLERLLSRVGLGEQILARWRRSPRWEQLRTQPLGESLKEVVEMLRAQWPEPNARPLGTRVVFFGPPGSGSTTALCKALTMDVFLRQKPAVVMKLDGDQPNPTEGLAMFCEALGVSLMRSADDLENIAEGHRFYFDTTGAVLHDAAAWRDLDRVFGEFYIETRVLVLNAAYEIDLLKRGYSLGREAGATHVVFTHLDEVHHWGKLWDLLIGGGLQPLFFSCGQNVSGDLREDTFELMIHHMFGGLKS
jgi:flagellar biosynthesis protein FlhF